MPITALVNGEERTAPLLSDVEWEVLREFAASGAVKVATTCCHAPAEPISVKGGYRYFKAPSCSHFRDTTNTLILETALIRGIVSAGWSTRCNVVGGDLNAWTADIIATSPDGARRVGFIIEPHEPKASRLGDYVIQATRMGNAGIAAIFLFPSIPKDAMWRFVHEGKLITTAKYVPGRAMVAGLDATLFASVALKAQPVPRTGRIRSFRVTTRARPARQDGTETVVYAKGTKHERPLDPTDFVVGFSADYLGEEIYSAEWPWGPNSDVLHTIRERAESHNESVDELLLLTAEMGAMCMALGHFVDASGMFYQARNIALGLIIKTSGNPRMNAIVDDFLQGGFKERYYVVYPRFFYLVKRDILELRTKCGYVVALSTAQSV